jgi:hypothetical protein
MFPAFIEIVRQCLAWAHLVGAIENHPHNSTRIKRILSSRVVYQVAAFKSRDADSQRASQSSSISSAHGATSNPSALRISIDAGKQRMKRAAAAKGQTSGVNLNCNVTTECEACSEQVRAIA